jgi:RNA polymerase sigma-70 factor (ECF subfamily)
MLSFPPPFLQPHRSDPDRDLVEEARRGCERAYDALVFRYQGRLTQFVRARLDAAIDADDVTQEVLVAAWRELPRFRGRSRFKTWLFGIALNHCAEAARRHTRLRRALGEWEEALGELPSPSPGDGAWCAALAERSEVQERLARLPEAERQVLQLYYYADLTLREVAELLSVNLSTLKYRFYQAHRRLRQLQDEAAPGTAEGPPAAPLPPRAPRRAPR